MAPFFSALAVIAAAHLHTLYALNIPARNSVRTSLPESLPNPLTDPFYLVPADISSYSPGDVVRSRQVSTLVTGSSVDSYQVFYRTTNQQNESTGTVATIWVPAIPARPAKIYSYQVAEDAIGLQCAPSWSWVNSSSQIASNSLNEGFIVPWALSQGWYVVSADFEGPESAWLVGLIEGRGVLDGIRATANYMDLCTKDLEVAMMGYSGGAHATIWAASLAQAYAPELNIVGVASGGTPVDLVDVYNYVEGGPFAALGPSAFIGNARAVPKTNDTLYPLLTSKGKEIWQSLQAPDFCLLANATILAGANFTTFFTKNPFDIPYVNYTNSEQSLLSNVSPLPIPVPKFPRLQWHGLADKTIPYAPDVEYVKQQCAKGADIRLALFPGLDHVPNELNGAPGALLFIKQAFDKTLVKGSCGSNTTFPAIGSKAAIELLGIDNNVALAGLLQTAIKASAAEDELP